MAFKGAQRGRQRPKINRPQLDNRDFMSYHSSRLPRDSGSGRPKRHQDSDDRRLKLGNLPFYVAIAVMLICAGYVMTLESQAKVQVISNTSDNVLLRPKEVYETAAEQLLADSLLNRTKLTINITGLQNKLEAQFPELESASITLPLIGHRPIVDIVPRLPVLKLATQQGVYLVDREGRVLIKTTEATNQANLAVPQVFDESNIDIKAGQGILTSQSVSFITILVDQMTSAKLEIENLILPIAPNEVRLRITGRPYFVKFNLENDPRLSAGAFLALKKQFDTQNSQPSEYIDLRLDEKAFYK